MNTFRGNIQLAERVAILVLIVFLAFLVLLPVGTLWWGSLRDAPPLQEGNFTLSNYPNALDNQFLGSAAINTVALGLGTTIFSVGLGTGFAWIVARTNTPGRKLFEFLIMILFLTPGILAVVAWSLLLDPRTGLLNNLFNRIPLVPGLDVYSLGGMIWVQGLFLMPLAFFIMMAAMQAMDPSLEESARMSGSGPLSTLTRVTLPVLRPALVSGALLMFIIAIEQFEIPYLLGARNREYVFSSFIYFQLRGRFPPDYGAASALSTILLIVSFLGLWIYIASTRHSRRFETIRGKGFATRVFDLGSWRYAIAAASWLFFAVAIFVPFLVILLASGLRFVGALDASVFGRLSWDNYLRVFNHPSLLEATLNSLLLATLVGAATVLVATIVGYLIIKRKVAGRKTLEGLTMIPIAYPSTVLAVGLLWAYAPLKIPVYGTLGILAIAYMTRYLPIAFRSVSGAVTQVSDEMEEASRMSGAPTFYGVARVILPLLKRPMLAAWVVLFMILMKELSMSVLLAGRGNTVISVLLFDFYESGEVGMLSAFATVFILFVISIVYILQRVLSISVVVH